MVAVTDFLTVFVTVVVARMGLATKHAHACDKADMDSLNESNGLGVEVASCRGNTAPPYADVSVIVELFDPSARLRALSISGAVVLTSSNS